MNRDRNGFVRYPVASANPFGSSDGSTSRRSSIEQSEGGDGSREGRRPRGIYAEGSGQSRPALGMVSIYEDHIASTRQPHVDIRGTAL